MAIEKRGEDLYRSFVRDISDKGAVYIFTWLADQEKEHYGVFQKIKETGSLLVGKNPDLKGVKEVFSNWKETRARLSVKAASQVDLYRQALDIEEKSVQLYEEGARTAINDAVKNVFLSIASEEKIHRQLMENIIELVIKPEYWTENAEFGYRGKDYYL